MKHRWLGLACRPPLDLCLCLATFAIWIVAIMQADGGEPPITSIAFTPDGKQVVTCSQSGIRVRDWPKLVLKQTLSTTTENPHHLEFSPDGELLAIGGGEPAQFGTVEILNWETRETFAKRQVHEDTVMHLLWLSDSQLVTASLDSDVSIWSTLDGKQVRTMSGHSRGVTSLCTLANEGVLVSAGIDQSLRVWHYDSGELVRSLNIHTKPVRDLEERPTQDGLPLIASISTDRTVRFWQPTIGRMVRFARLPSTPLDASWSSDGKIIGVACEDGRLRLVDPETVNVTAELLAIDGWAFSVAGHPTDGSFAVAGDAGEIVRVLPLR